MTTAPATSRPRSGRRSSPADLAELRGAAYELLGALFCYPAPGDLAEVVAAARDFPARRCLAPELAFFPPLRALCDRLLGLEESDLDGLEGEYVKLFLVSTSQAPCPPYESAYREREGRERGLVAVAVERAYAASGVALSDGRELPDHASLELGFLSLLCEEEERAWREGDAERSVGCLRREEEFHEQHLQRWFPTFTRRLAHAAPPDSLYGLLAEAARAFVVHDGDLVRMLLAELSP